MRFKLIYLSVLIIFATLSNRINGQAGKINTASDTLVVVWSSGDPDVADKVCLMYTHAAKRNHWFEEVILVVWGPSQMTLAENKDLQKKVSDMAGDGIILEACIACSNKLGVTDELKAMELDVKGMGVPLTHYLKRGYKILYF